MSLLFPDRLLLSLQPHALAWSVFGLARKRISEGRAEADAAYGAEPWHGVVDALKRQAGAWQRERLRVRIVLSNHFVRYALVPEASAATPEEELALARFQFSRVHGERAKGWEVRLSPGRRGDRLACAVDRELLEALRACFPRSGRARLQSVQPYLMAAFNGWRRHIPREGAWLLLPEGDRTCLALLSATGWRSLSNTRGAADGPQAWAALIDGERHRAGGGAFPKVAFLPPDGGNLLVALGDVTPRILPVAAG